MIFVRGNDTISNEWKSKEENYVNTHDRFIGYPGGTDHCDGRFVLPGQENAEKVRGAGRADGSCCADHSVARHR